MSGDITNQQLLDAMTQQLGVITDNMVTKDDLRQELKKFATKDELKKFATKEDLKKFATKEDLKRFATKKDMEALVTKEDAKAFVTKEDARAFATKDDLKTFATRDDMQGVESRLQLSIGRVERQLKSNRRTNVAHHLETRGMIGDLHRQVGKLRDGLGQPNPSK